MSAGFIIEAFEFMNGPQAGDRFIIRYAGQPVMFTECSRHCHFVQDDCLAERFPTELDAWNTARMEGLNLNHVTVVPLRKHADRQVRPAGQAA